MSTSLLLIHSSPLGEHSASRKLTAKLADKIKSDTPDITIVERDLVATEIPHLSGMEVGAVFTPELFDEAQVNSILALSNELINEIIKADVIVIGAPMWNFGVPSYLKAWIDHIVRPGVTFKFGEQGAEGLLSADKKVFIASTRGGIYSSGPAQVMDHQESFLTTVLGFIGLKDITFIRAEGLGMGEEAAAAAIEAAEAKITEVV